MKRTMRLMMFLTLLGCASLSEARDPPRIYRQTSHRAFPATPRRLGQQLSHQPSYQPSLFVPFFDPAPLSSLQQPLPPPYSDGLS